MITRTLEKKLRELAGYYPAVVVTGPRQSGKTTFAGWRIRTPYVSLEAIDIRDFAVTIRVGFWRSMPVEPLLMKFSMPRIAHLLTERN